MSVEIESPRRLPTVPAAGDESSGPALQTMGDDVALRTSNEVEGFQYSRFKAVLFTVGIVFKLPFLPLWPIFIAKEAGDWSIARSYFRTLLYCFKTVLDHIRYGSFFRLIKYNLLLSPDEVKRRIEQRRGACSRCAKCCQHHQCIFLGQDEASGDYYCKVYKTDYWYYGTCGRYPIDQQDIDFHACPGFAFEREPAAKTAD